MEDKEQKPEQKPTSKDHKWLGGTLLRGITGWALLFAAAGTFFDAFAGAPEGQGTVGLIPLYIGFPIGSVGLVLVIKQISGWVPALLAAIGLVGILIFMFTYPNGADAWIGAILIGIAHLYLPLAGRFASVLWVAAGILGFPEFGSPTWGIISAFTMFGAATAASGTFVLWGAESTSTDTVSK